jgi:rubrerythrin
MTVITPNRSTGARGTSIEMTEVPPEVRMPGEALAAIAPDAGINAAFVADLLSSFIAHEQCAVHLYRTVEGLTANPMLQAKYRDFLGDSQRHVDILMQVVAQTGGEPQYVSPAARLVHAMNTHLVESVVLAAGSADELPREMAMLEAVVLGETKDHANWSFLSSLCEKMSDGPSRDALRAAVDQVEPEEDEHVGWAKQTWQRMNTMQATSSTMMKITDFAEKAFASVKNSVSGS